MGGIVERHKELGRRRHRRKKLAIIKRKALKASTSEKAVLAQKLRLMTPGAESIIAALKLEE